jgi:hypothetical protein
MPRVGASTGGSLRGDSGSRGARFVRYQLSDALAAAASLHDLNQEKFYDNCG